MIEVVSVEKPKKLAITPEMALSAARVLRDFCNQHERCIDCEIRKTRICHKMTPCGWRIPERGNSNGKAD